MPSLPGSMAVNASRDAQPKKAYESIERQRISGLHRAKEPAPVNTVDAVLKEVSPLCMFADWLFHLVACSHPLGICWVASKHIDMHNKVAERRA